MINSRLDFILLVLAALAAAGPAHGGDVPSKPAEGSAAPAVPIELQAYQVAIIAGFAADAGFLPEQRAALLAELQAGLDRCLGQMWQYSVREDQLLDAGGFAALNRCTPREAQSLFQAESRGRKLDKGYLLAIENAGAGYRVLGREWDAATELLSQPVTRVVYDRRELVHGLMGVVRELFRPLATVETSLTGSVRLHARAGELTPGDADWSPLRVGQFLEPFQRSIGPAVTAGNASTASVASAPAPTVQAVPWTYLKVEKVDRAMGTCKLLTALRAPLTPRRRRTEVLVLEVRPATRKPRLRLLSLAKPVKPLVGLEVDVTTDAKQKRPPLVSDRAGAVKLPDHLGAPYAWLSVRSGDAVLARIPFVPGIEIPESIQLPDDTARINVERSLSALQSELVDTVARRAMLFALARRSAKADDWKQVDEHLTLLAKLPGKPAFLRKLNATRVTALDKAASQKASAVIVGRIKKICADAEELVGHYLDDDKLREFHEEITELRAIAKEDAAASSGAGSPAKQAAPKPAEAAAPAAPKPNAAKPGF